MSPSALRIERLELRNFRNLEPLALEPGPRFNVFSGQNGAGKTSLLEAIHYLGALRSFRSGRTEDLIRLGDDEALASARLVGDLAPRVFRIALSRVRARAVTIDGKRPRNHAVHAAALPVVVFHPGDLALASGGSEGRRAFLDRVLEQIDPTYSPVLAEYEKARSSRNRLLKQESVDRRAITVYDEMLATRAVVIGTARAEILTDLAPRIEAAFGAIVGEHLPLRVRYEPRVAPTVRAMRTALAESFEKDRARGFTAEGPHGDEIAIAMKDVRARHHASQGQHRAMALAMRLAELDVIASRTGRIPLLLLDDVSSELDPERNRRLFERIASVGGQVFLTTTQPSLIRLDVERRDFAVRSGTVAASSDSSSATQVGSD